MHTLNSFSRLFATRIYKRDWCADRDCLMNRAVLVSLIWLGALSLFFYPFTRVPTTDGIRFINIHAVVYRKLVTCLSDELSRADVTHSLNCRIVKPTWSSSVINGDFFSKIYIRIFIRRGSAVDSRTHHAGEYTSGGSSLRELESEFRSERERERERAWRARGWHAGYINAEEEGEKEELEIERIRVYVRARIYFIWQNALKISMAGVEQKKKYLVNSKFYHEFVEINDLFFLFFFKWWSSVVLDKLIHQHI